MSSTVNWLPSRPSNHVSFKSTLGSIIIYNNVHFTAAPTGPPLNFVIDVSGTVLDFSWEQPAEDQRSGLIRYYTLTCTPDGGESIVFNLLNVTLFSMNDFLLDTSYTCTLSASTSGGPGPTTTAMASTAIGMQHKIIGKVSRVFLSVRCG